MRHYRRQAAGLAAFILIASAITVHAEVDIETLENQDINIETLENQEIDIETLENQEADIETAENQETDIETPENQEVDIETMESMGADVETPLPVPESSIPQIVLGEYFQSLYNEDMDSYYGNVSWQEVNLSEESADVYPALQSALEEYNQQLTEAGMSMVDTLSMENTLEIIQNNPDMTLSYEQRIQVCRADEKYVGLEEHFSQYTGGAHGYYGIVGANFDVAEGRQLVLADLVPDEDGFRDAVAAELKKNYPPDTYVSMENVEETLAAYGTGEEQVPFNWVLKDDGITVHFNPYEIASYAEGLLSADIRFDDYPDLFNDGCRGDKYGFREISMWEQVPADLDGDGEDEIISVEADTDEYGGYSRYRVKVNEESTEREVFCWNFRPFLLENGEDMYLYLFMTSDNDWQSLDVYSLGSRGPKFVDGFDNLGISTDYQLPSVYREWTLTDPSAFRLASRINLLSTYSGIRYYSVGEDGLPVPLFDEYYRAKDGYVMPLKTIDSLWGYPVDMDTLQVGTEQVDIAAGELLQIWKTDGDSYVDLIREDGTALRVNIQSNEDSWGFLVCGKPENECFETLYYAG